MAFTVAQLETFAKLIADFVPLPLLYDLRHPDVVLALDTWRRDDNDDMQRIAQRIVMAYAARHLVPALAHVLYRRLYRDDVLAVRFVPFCSEPGEDTENHQAALKQRANTLASRDLRDFLAESEPRICAVVAEAGRGSKQGTGFLVGPNLILTTYHTLEDYIEDGKGVLPAGRLWAFFDHLDGDPISDIDPSNYGLRKVAFAEDWLLPPASKLMMKDGTYKNPSAEEIRLLQENLDFVLVRLAEPVGLESYAGNGGQRRWWFKVSSTMPMLREHERVIIPQHPNGQRQQHDFGRFVEVCKSETRIRYDTETDRGTSGAPCFDSKFRLIGMHNAAYRPDGVDTWNQAIRFDRIACLIDGTLQTQPAVAKEEARLWSVTAKPQLPKAIVGRAKFIDWIGRAGSTAAEPGDRVFIASGTGAKSGRSFSIEILRAARRGSGDLVVELGTSRFPLPASVGDVLQAIVTQLSFDCDVANAIPKRPAIDDAGTSDKLPTWASEVVPKWFGQLLSKHRVVTYDAGEIARETVALDRRVGREPTPENAALAAVLEPQPASHIRWERVWIAVRIAETTMSADVADLLLGLAGHGKMAALSDFERIRVVLLGAVPDQCVKLDSATTEELNPLGIGEDEFVECARAIADDTGCPFTPQSQKLVFGVARGFLSLPEALVSERRLSMMQETLAGLAEVIQTSARDGARL